MEYLCYLDISISISGRKGATLLPWIKRRCLALEQNSFVSRLQIIFFFWSFEISECILRNQNIIIGLNSFPNLSLHLDYTILCISYPDEKCEIAVILFGSVLPHL